VTPEQKDKNVGPKQRRGLEKKARGEMGKKKKEKKADLMEKSKNGGSEQSTQR